MLLGTDNALSPLAMALGIRAGASLSAVPTGLLIFLRSFAADIFWAYALAFAVLSVLGYTRRHLPVCFVLCAGFSAGMELLQRTGLFPGTFDPLDIVFEFLSILLALIIFYFEEAAYEEFYKET